MSEISIFLEDLQNKGLWFSLPLIATFIVILIRGLLVGIGHAFNMQELERNSKAEIIQAIATFLILVFIVEIILGVESYIIKDVLGAASYIKCGANQIPVVDPNTENTLNLMEVIKCRVNEKAYMLADMQEKVYSNAYWPFWKLSIVVSVAGVPAFQGSWIDTWFSEAEQMRLLNIVITTLLIGLNGILVFINYVKSNMLPVFLPVGIVLRAFNFTRGVGAFFISIALGLYLIFPLIFVLTDPGFVKVSSYEVFPQQIKPTSCYPVFSGVVSAVTAAQQDSAVGSASIIQKTVSDLQSIYMLLLLHPFVVLAITLIFVRYLMYLFGGEPQDIMRYVARVI